MIGRARRPQRPALAAAAAMLALALASCDSPPAAPSGAREADEAREPPGAPSSRVPGSLGELLARGEEHASSWQSDPRLSELFVELGSDGGWDAAHLTYLAGGGDRMLVVSFTPEGVSQQRPTLETFGLAPIPGEALAQLPAAADLQEPAALAGSAAPALRACGLPAGADAVLYATGAPVSWDAAAGAWSPPPEWSATVFAAGESGRGVVLDPVSGEAVGDGCLADGS